MSSVADTLDQIKSGGETVPVEEALLVLLVSLPTCCCYRLSALFEAVAMALEANKNTAGGEKEREEEEQKFATNNERELYTEERKERERERKRH